MGIMPRELARTQMSISVADNAGLVVQGAAFVTLSGEGGVTCGQTVYFCSGLEEFFISKEAMRALGIIGEEFPRLGLFSGGNRRRRSSSQPRPLTTICGNLGGHEVAPGSPVNVPHAGINDAMSPM